MKYLTKNIRRSELMDLKWIAQVALATEKPEYKAFRDAYLTTYMETANMQAQIAAQNFFNKFSKQKFINTLSEN